MSAPRRNLTLVTAFFEGSPRALSHTGYTFRSWARVSRPHSDKWQGEACRPKGGGSRPAWAWAFLHVRQRGGHLAAAATHSARVGL